MKLKQLLKFHTRPKFYARWYAWAFGAGLMVTLGVVTVLPLLKEHSFSQWALLIGLFLYFIASLVTSWDDISRLSKK